MDLGIDSKEERIEFAKQYLEHFKVRRASEGNISFIPRDQSQSSTKSTLRVAGEILEGEILTPRKVQQIIQDYFMINKTFNDLLEDFQSNLVQQEHVEKEVIELRGKLAEKDDLLVNHLEQLEKQLQSTLKENEKLKKALNEKAAPEQDVSLKTENQSLKEEVERLKNEVESAKAATQTLQIRVLEMEFELEESQQKKSPEGDELAKYISGMTMMEEALTLLKDEILKVKGQQLIENEEEVSVGKLLEILIKSREELNLLRAEKAEYEKQIDELNSQLDSYSRENGEMKAILTEKDMPILEQPDDVTLMSNEIKDLKGQIEFFQKHASDLETVNMMLKTEADTIKAEKTKLLADVEELKMEIEEIRYSRDFIRGETVQQHRDLVFIQEMLKREIDQKSSTITAMQAELNEKNTRLDYLEAQFNVIKDKLHISEAEDEKFADSILEVAVERDQLKSQIEESKKELEKSCGEMLSMQYKLQKDQVIQEEPLDESIVKPIENSLPFNDFIFTPRKQVQFTQTQSSPSASDSIFGEENELQHEKSIYDEEPSFYYDFASDDKAEGDKVKARLESENQRLESENSLLHVQLAEKQFIANGLEEQLLSLKTDLKQVKEQLIQSDRDERLVQTIVDAVEKCQTFEGMRNYVKVAFEMVQENQEYLEKEKNELITKLQCDLDEERKMRNIESTTIETLVMEMEKYVEKGKLNAVVNQKLLQLNEDFSTIVEFMKNEGSLLHESIRELRHSFKFEERKDHFVKELGSSFDLTSGTSQFCNPIHTRSNMSLAESHNDMDEDIESIFNANNVVLNQFDELCEKINMNKPVSPDSAVKQLFEDTKEMFSALMRRIDENGTSKLQSDQIQQFCSIFEAEIDALSRQLNVIINQYQSLRREQQKSSRSLLFDRIDLQNRCSLLEKEVESLKKTLQRTLSDSKEISAISESESSRQRELVAELENRIEFLKAQLDANLESAQLFEIDGQFENLKSQMIKFKSENAHLLSENSRLLSENSLLLSENSRLSSDNLRLSTENSQSSSELYNCRSIIEEKENSYNQLQQMLHEHADVLQFIKKEVAEKDKMLAEMNENYNVEITRLSTLNQSYADENNVLKERYATIKSEFDKKLTEIEEAMESTIPEIENRYAMAMNEEIKSVSHKVSILENELAMQKDLSNKYERSLCAEVELKNGLEKENHFLNKSLQKEQKRSADLIFQKQYLMVDNASLKECEEAAISFLNNLGISPFERKSKRTWKSKVKAAITTATAIKSMQRQLTTLS